MTVEARYRLIEKSTNRKTGPCTVVQAHSGTCWNGCPFRRVCYGQLNWVGLHQRKLDAGLAGVSFKSLVDKLEKVENTLVRYADAGDLPGMNGEINERQIWALTRALLGKLGWCYTHKPVLGRLRRNRRIISELRGGPLVVNLSAEGWRKADELCDLEIAPVATVLPRTMMPENWSLSRTKKGRKIVRCPAEYTDVTCHTCGGGRPFCARWNRESIVGFTAHGATWKKVDQIIAEVEMGLIG